MIKREHYLKRIRGFYDSDLIKIIIGIRRCGKSIILEQIMNEIKEKTDNIIYLNFEDEREFRAFNNIDNNLKKILITNDEIDYSTSVIEHIKLKDFLLMIKKTTKNRFKYLLVVFI